MKHMKHKAKFIKEGKSYKKVTNRKEFEDALSESRRVSNLIEFYKKLNSNKKEDVYETSSTGNVRIVSEGFKRVDEKDLNTQMK